MIVAHLPVADILIASKRDSAIVGLLDACVKNLQHQGMRRMFMDGVASGLEEFKQLGESPSRSRLLAEADKNRF